MADDPHLRGAFRSPFPRALDAARRRFDDLVPTHTWMDLQREQHDRSFVVAGALRADLLADLALAVETAMVEGRGLDHFRGEFKRIVADHGWSGWTGEETERGVAWRTRVIWQTNIAVSYAAGRREQLLRSGFKYWVYRHGGSLHPRLHHLALDGLVLPPDHPFWLTHSPPNGWGCSCYITGAHGPAGLRAAGGDPSKTLPDGWDVVDPATGRTPFVERGWNYAPGASIIETMHAAARTVAALPPPIGSDYGASVAAIIDRAWPVWLRDAEAPHRAKRPTLVGAFSADQLAALGARGVTPLAADIAATPRTIAGSWASLLVDDWLRVPLVLRSPAAILRDPRTGHLFFLSPSDPLMMIEVVCRDRRIGLATNVITGGARVTIEELRARVADGTLELLTGALR